MRQANPNPDGGALRQDVGPGIPTQDPSAMTWQALLRENFWLRELTEEQRNTLIQRIDGMATAVKLLQNFADRTPTTMDVQHEVHALKAVMDVTIAGINKAVDAAFAASKEVVSDSKTSFTKQIDSIVTQVDTKFKALDDKHGDMKERLTVIESKTSVLDPTNAIALAELKEKVSRLTTTTDFTGGKSAGANWLWGVIAGVLGLGFGLGTLVGSLMRFMK